MIKMMDKAIEDFFEERKANWLKKNVTAALSEVEVKEKNIECEELFSLKNWLPNAAKRAGQISISTHPCTFSHPSARKNKNGYATSIIAENKQANDGFLRSGNVDVSPDALGNAAALDVYKFLTLTLSDGQSLLGHIERDTELAINLLTLSGNDIPDYESLKQGFLAMKSGGTENISSAKIKQVYFPVSDITDADDMAYHQLSVLTASGILFDLRKRIDNMRFGDEIKQAREHRREKKAYDNHKEIAGLATIAYGGTKPQNISVLNSQNGGKAHLFMSIPPKIKESETLFPRVDFFKQTVRYSHCRTQFQKLHILYNQNANNMHVRQARDELYQDIVDYIVEKMWQVRAVAFEQYFENSNELPRAQKFWLCDEYKEARVLESWWLDELENSITSFIFYGYEKILARRAIKLGNAEYSHMASVVSQNAELLR
ncbi:type I-F CRISPR-associated protein Csy1 [Agaribacter flavus]|uniref:Type I-F CRISPR-associated protein Csy1 n=1 Tax=Agaribacter flavus TaxID=1902781 RepID=A0ABV7FV40_9ALTE